jgi:bifunctional DNA-binding transcriptional regulator/antitoxin component of YhaV-PrlF toxin-antitoxin module
MKKQFSLKLNGDESGKSEGASFTLPFDTREVWGKARVPVKVTINQYTWRSTVANMGGKQYIVVNGEARQKAGVKAGDFVTVTLEPDTEKRDIEIPAELRKALGAKLAAKLDGLAFTHKKEFVKWYAETRKEETRLRRVEKMKSMLTSGATIS